MVRRKGRSPAGKGPSRMLRYVVFITVGSLIALSIFIYSLSLPTPDLMIAGFIMGLAVFVITFGGTVICSWREAQIEVRGPSF